MPVCSSSSERSLVQTVDFFTPIVDDPFVYGQIAAANAVERRLRDGRAAAHRARDRRVSQGISFGDPRDRSSGRRPDKLAEAGTALLGGHTVQDSEVKFGYAPDW